MIAPRSSDGCDSVVREGTLTLARVLPRSALPATVSDAIASRRWATRLADRQFDVLLAHSCNTAHGLVRANLGLPLVYVFHSDAGREQAYLGSMLPRGRERLQAQALGIPLGRYEAAALDAATTVIVLSDFSRQLLHDRSPAAALRAAFVSGAVDTDVFTDRGRDEDRAALGIEPSEQVAFTARRLVPRMGMDKLVEAMALLPDLTNLKLLIAGTGELEQSLQQRAQALGLAANVQFLGRVPDDDLPRWHRAADLFVLPTAAYEGFGLVTAEALASGTPVVGTPVGATPELLAPIDPRLLMAGVDSQAIADGIRAGLALGSPALRRACRTAAVERHSWDAVMPEWEQLLVQAIRRPRVSVTRRSARRTAIGVASSGIRWSGAPVAARHLRHRDRAGIVVYHDPSPVALERQLEALSRRHRFVKLDDIVDALREGAWDDIPPKSIAVTIDDGFRGNVRLVDVFAAFGVVPTLFLCSGIVGTDDPYWWTLPGLDVESLKRDPNSVRLAKVQAAVAEARLERQALSREEIGALDHVFDFGAHTSTHPILPRCADAEARLEIEGSRAEVERLTGRPCSHFAFPNGDFGARELELVRAAGYRSSRTTIAGWVTPDTDPYRLPIIPMPDDATGDRAASQIAVVTFGSRLVNRHAPPEQARAASVLSPEPR